MALHSSILACEIPWTEEPGGIQSMESKRVGYDLETKHAQFSVFSSGQFSSDALCDSMDCSTQASLSITNSQSLFRLMSIESVMPSDHLILCHPLLLLPSIFPSFRVFSNESVLHIRQPKYWSYSFSVSPSNVYSVLISFRIDWFDLLAVQGTLKSLLQHHSSKTSILWRSAFFTVHLTPIHDYWKNHSFDQMDLCWQSNVFAF